MALSKHNAMARSSHRGAKDYADLELWDQFVTKETVARPAAYLVPAASKTAVETLLKHGLPVQVLREDRELPVEAYKIQDVARSDRAFQGHKLVTDIKVEPHAETRMIPAGTLVVPATAPLGSLAVVLLEPRSEDGLATWGAFDDKLVAGEEFPVLRLPAMPELTLLTAPMYYGEELRQSDGTGANGAPPDRVRAAGENRARSWRCRIPGLARRQPLCPAQRRQEVEGGSRHRPCGTTSR